ncbi:MAG: DUF805 domain-containing protein [Sphingomonas sp.]
MNYMFLPLQRYADFNGRSRRMEYWMFVLLQLIVFGAIMIVGGMMFGSSMPAPNADGTIDPEAMNAVAAGGLGGLMIVYCLAALAFLIPTIAVMVRRFHDQDKSGWLVLLNFVPFVGGLIVLVFMLLPGTVGPNRYGDDPKDG